jgi:hypothetical protein
MIHAALRLAKKVRSLKSASHTSAYGNGDADYAVPRLKRKKGGDWAAPPDCIYLPGWSWPLRWAGLHLRCPDSSPTSTLKNWLAAFAGTCLKHSWTPRCASTERIQMKSIAKQTWTKEAAVEISLRNAKEQLRQRGFPLQFWRKVPPADPSLKQRWATWTPRLRGMRLECGFGCRSCRDCEEHVYECIQRRSLHTLYRGIRKAFIAIGIDHGSATVLSHYPPVIEQLLHRQVPDMWDEILPEITKDQKKVRALFNVVDLAVAKFHEKNRSSTQERDRKVAIDRFKSMATTSDLLVDSAPEGTELILPTPINWMACSPSGGPGWQRWAKPDLK